MTDHNKNHGTKRRSTSTIMLHQIFHGRRRNLILPIATLLISITLCLPVLLVANFDNINIDRHLRTIKRSIANIHIPTPAIKVKVNAAQRILNYNNDDFDIPSAVEDHGDDVLQLPSNIHLPSIPSALEPLPPYSLTNVLQTLPYFHDTFAVLVYDPPTDKFIAHYSNNMRWISSCHKLVTSIKTVSNSLRMLFPRRFAPDNVDGTPEFAMAISSADYPGVQWNDCLREERTDCISGDVELAPILQFGSAFRKPIFPTMMAMPMSQMNHLNCFHYWALHRLVCNSYLPRSPENPNGLVFSEHIGLEYEKLIPQVVWRGTDFSYLHKMVPSLRPPNFDMDIASQIDLSGRIDKKTAATHAMRQVYDELIPRWKGVVWTAEAERESEMIENERNRKNRIKRRSQRQRKGALPWCNIKFAGAMSMGKKTPTGEIEYYQQFEEYGIPAAGEGMSLETLGGYKYHIDLGGGGGTTWSGTVEKLGLPGLLFHHVTPTKDYIHDLLVPWEHYVPIRADLSDLRAKYEWAESHPAMAKRISENATELARSLSTPEGFEAMFRQFFELPLQQVMEAYQPLEQGSDWREAMAQMVGEELRPIMQCGGYFHHDCERLTDDIQFTRMHDRDVNMSS